MCVAGVMEMVDELGRASVIRGGGTPNDAGLVRRGWKNMTSHFSESMEKPDWCSHWKTDRAAFESLSAVPWYVGLEANMFPLST